MSKNTKPTLKTYLKIKRVICYERIGRIVTPSNNSIPGRITPSTLPQRMSRSVSGTCSLVSSRSSPSNHPPNKTKIAYPAPSVNTRQGDTLIERPVCTRSFSNDKPFTRLGETNDQASELVNKQVGLMSERSKLFTQQYVRHSPANVGLRFKKCSLFSLTLPHTAK